MSCTMTDREIPLDGCDDPSGITDVIEQGYSFTGGSVYDWCPPRPIV